MDKTIVLPKYPWGVGGLLPNLLSDRMSTNNIDYREYITSEVWFEIAKRIKKRDKGCLVCKRRTNLNAHHGTYKHLGHEFEGELFTLCEYHHKKLHDKFERAKKKNRRVSLLSFTEQFIKKNAKSSWKKSKLLGLGTFKITPKEKKKVGAFDGVLAMVASQFPKEEAVVKKTIKFKSRNQLIVERLRKERKEKLERRRIRRKQL